MSGTKRQLKNAFLRLSLKINIFGYLEGFLAFLTLKIKNNRFFEMNIFLSK